MKKFLFIVSFLLCSSVFISVNGQTPPPPPPPNGGMNSGHGLGGNQGAENAPIGGGLEILLILGAFYTGKKIYHVRKKQDEE
ncbi:MAG: hypothetical protein IPH84_06850 [Bacteroidales bacterium]|nr:hypothetical protein [Bacteroidales bacterium]